MQNVATRTALPRSGRRAGDLEAQSQTGDKWNTPVVVRNVLRQFAHDKPIALDPCSNPSSTMHADVEWYGPDHGGTDGLLAPWGMAVEPNSSKLVFVNPPYSEKYLWMRKCHDEDRRLRQAGVSIVGLVPADTDTAWFHEFCTTADAVCFWRGRLTFGGDRTDSARFPNILPYWGRFAQRFSQIFSSYGHVVVRA